MTNVIIRNINISLLTNSKLKQPYKKIFETIISTFNGLDIYIPKNKENFNVLGKTGKLYLISTNTRPTTLFIDSKVFKNLKNNMSYLINREELDTTILWYINQKYNYDFTTLKLLSIKEALKHMSFGEKDLKKVSK